jgi:histidyl-tRNA synthetase
LYQAVRGTVDILPDEQAYWRYAEQGAEAVSRLYGYRRIDSPTFEETGLFTRSVGNATDIVDKEMYTFEDRGGGSLTLSLLIPFSARGTRALHGRSSSDV